MIKRNVFKQIPHPLQLNVDFRGSICDIFYHTKINHVAIIKSKKNSIRGNHFHKKTTQHILILKGQLEYWYKNYNKKKSISTFVIANEGDMISTPPFEIHALRITKKNEFIVFSQGLRGGKDYEKDTFRVDNIIKS